MDAPFVAYLWFASLFAITPGATTAIVVRNTLAGARRGGLATALGALTSNLAYGLASGLGLAVLLMTRPALFASLRLLGALYLAWLGAISLWRVRHDDGGFRPFADASHPEAIATAGRSYREGLVFNLLNPSIAGFYLTIVPSFMPPGAGTTRFFLMAGTHALIAFSCHAFWVMSLDAARRLFDRPGRRRVLQALTGLAMIGLAARLLWR